MKLRFSRIGRQNYKIDVKKNGLEAKNWMKSPLVTKYGGSKIWKPWLFCLKFKLSSEKGVFLKFSWANRLRRLPLRRSRRDTRNQKKIRPNRSFLRKVMAIQSFALAQRDKPLSFSGGRFDLTSNGEISSRRSKWVVIMLKWWTESKDIAFWSFTWNNAFICSLLLFLSKGPRWRGWSWRLETERWSRNRGVESTSSSWW